MISNSEIKDFGSFKPFTNNICFFSILIMPVNAGAGAYLSAILQGQCQSWEYQCKRSGECVPISFLCDFKRHCEDGSDEEECGMIASMLAYSQTK